MDIPLDNSIFYTITYNTDDILHQFSQEYITNINQPHLITTSNNHIHDNFPLLIDNAKITVFFPKEMQSPKQGYLFQNDGDTSYFKPGRK